MTEARPTPERELTLLSLVLFARRRWKMLLAVGVIAGILAAIVLSVTPATYLATANVLVMRTRSKSEMVGLDRTVIEPDYFAAALEGDEVLETTLERFKLNEDPYRFDIEKMRSVVSVSPIRNENSIQIQVRLPALSPEETPKLVAEIANSLAEEANSISNRLLQEDIKRSRVLFDEEYQRAEKHLAASRQKYQVAALEAPLLEKQYEIENFQLYQRQLQASLALAIADLEQKGPKLGELEILLEDEKPLLTVVRELEEEPSLLGVFGEATGKGTSELYSATSITQIPNEVYTNLRNLHDTTRSEVAGLINAVTELQEDIAEINLKIRAAERIFTASKEAVEFYADVLETAVLTHREADQKHKTAVMSIISDRQDLISLSPALPPHKPSGVSRLVLVVVSPLIAMIFFLALLFLAEVLRVSVAPGER